MKRRPKGVYSRNTPDWFLDRLHSGGAFSLGVTNQITYCCLYNDSAVGEDIIVTGFWHVVSGGNLIFEYAAGENGLTQYSAGFNVTPTMPRLAGVTLVGNKATCFGTEIANFGGQNTPNAWPYDWPIVRIPPGYMFAVHGDTNNVVLNCSFWWVVLPD